MRAELCVQREAALTVAAADLMGERKGEPDARPVCVAVKIGAQAPFAARKRESVRGLLTERAAENAVRSLPV